MKDLRVFPPCLDYDWLILLQVIAECRELLGYPPSILAPFSFMLTLLLWAWGRLSQDLYNHAQSIYFTHCQVSIFWFLWAEVIRLPGNVICNLGSYLTVLIWLLQFHFLLVYMIYITICMSIFFPSVTKCAFHVLLWLLKLFWYN